MDIESKRKISPATITIVFLFSLALTGIGYRWLNQYKKFGYYIDLKNKVIVHGSEGLVTIYTLIAAGICLAIYGCYLLWAYNTKETA